MNIWYSGKNYHPSKYTYTKLNLGLHFEFRTLKGDFGISFGIDFCTEQSKFCAVALSECSQVTRKLYIAQLKL